MKSIGQVRGLATAAAMGCAAVLVPSVALAATGTGAPAAAAAATKVTVYVPDSGSDTVTPINAATNTARGHRDCPGGCHWCPDVVCRGLPALTVVPWSLTSVPDGVQMATVRHWKIHKTAAR